DTMFKYIVKRLLISIVILLGVSIIVYTMIRLMPNDYVDNKFSSQLAQGSIKLEDIQRFKELYGIGDNSFVGIMSGYFKWLGNLFKGDLGTSFKYQKPVGVVISQNMWISFAIAVVATILQFLIAIPLGISSATHQYSVRDYTVTVFTMIGISLPTYFFAAIVVKVFSVDLGWFPSNGLVYATKDYASNFAGQMDKFGDILAHLVLPIFVSVILSIGGLMRYTRTNTLEVLGADYIRTARAKGLSERKVIYKHAFRNTLIPLATLLAGILPSLFGGMMITEQVFGIDGIGRLAYQALKDGDIPFVMGYNMFLAVLTVIGTLLSDIMYSIVDPRVKLGK
ncbi:MAG: ABC transporter permease, partial [Candidatus Gallimonas sp.]